MTNPKHTDTSRSSNLVKECRLDAKAFRENTVYDSDGDPIRLIANAERLDQYADRIKTLEAENERLRKLTCATWFYMPDEGDRCWFSPHEVIDEMYDPEPGNHVFEVECATSLPSIWCAVRVTDDPDADERFTFTEHATEAEARAALKGTEG